MNRYGYTLSARDESQLTLEIRLAGFLGLCGSGDAVEALFSQPLSDADKATLDGIVAAHVPDPVGPAKRARAAADDILTATGDGRSVILRAVVLLAMDEINALRSWLTSFTGAVAAATSLADLKTRVAALPGLPARTKAQLVAALQGKSDAGEADSTV